MSSGASTPESPSRSQTLGGTFVAVAYALWGFLPLYFLTLAPSGPWEVVGWRIALSLVFCVVLLTLTRSWPALLRVVRSPRLLGWTALAGALIYVNWQVFLVAVLTGHVIESALGYFINPIITVLLGVFVLRERLRPAQWAAIGVAAAAVVVIVIGYGSFPWIALTLAGSFGLYGLVKKRIGGSVDAVSGLTLESAWLTPLAVVLLVVVGTTSGLTIFETGAVHATSLLLVGVVSSTPLLLFAAGTRRISLTVVGLLQFIAPVMQFITGAWLLGEPMPTERWIGFGLVWLALTVLTADSLIAARRGRPAASDVADLV